MKLLVMALLMSGCSTVKVGDPGYPKPAYAYDVDQPPSMTCVGAGSIVAQCFGN